MALLSSIIHQKLLEGFNGNSIFSLTIRSATLLLLYLLFERFMEGVTRLPPVSYEQPWLLAELLIRIGLLKLGVLVCVTILLAVYGSLIDRWSKMPNGIAIRYFVLFLALLMTWAFTVYGYNYYYNQGHYLDRLLLLALLLLLWFRPVFIYPFLLLAYTLMWQFNTPNLGGSVFAHKLQVMHVLVMFAAAFLVYAITGNRGMKSYLFMTLCLVAGAYWEAAFAKLQLGWLSYGHLNRIIISSYAHGWMTLLDQASVLDISNYLALLDRPMQYIVIAVEAGCLFILWKRSFSMALLLAVTLFHMAVFALYGFLFWPWALLDLALLWLLLKTNKQPNFSVYSRNHLLISIVLILFSGLWAKPPKLGWFDTPLTYTVRYTVVDEQGELYPLTTRFFEPYGDVITFSAFSYLVEDHAVLTGPYGVTMNRSLADKMDHPIIAEDVFAMESVQSSSYDKKKSARFYAFLTRYINNWNLYNKQVLDPGFLGPPAQFWNAVAGNSFHGQAPISKLIITEVTTLFDGENISEIRVIDMNRLTIPAIPEAMRW